MTANDDPAAEVLGLEARRQQALAAGDMAALSEIMADDLLHVHATGMVHTKAELLDFLRGTQRRVERRRLKVRVYGDTAVLTGDNVNRIERPGQPDRVVAVFATQVARREAGRWRFVSFQATPLPEPAAQT